MNAKTTARAKTADIYFDLVREFPLKPIRSQRAHTAALKVARRLMLHDENSLTPGERDYLQTLSMLIEAYEDEHHDIDTSNITPAMLLKHLMEEAGLKQVDLAPLLGAESRVSDIINGKRRISRAQAIALGKRFNMDAGAFL